MRKTSWGVQVRGLAIMVGVATLASGWPASASACEEGPSQDRLSMARCLLDEQRYHKAAVAAFDVLSHPCPSLTGAEARWILARSLEAIGLPQLAAFWYRDVVRYGRTGGPFTGRALPAWAYVAVRLDDTGELIQRLEPLPPPSGSHDPDKETPARLPDGDVDLDPDTNDPGAIEAYRYLKGVALWESGDPGGARRVLEQVARVDTLVGWQAGYVLSVLEVAGGKRDAAYNRLVPLTRGTPDLPLSGAESLEGLVTRIQDLAHLGMARIQYAAGEYEDALLLYDRLSPESAYWRRAMYEAAWAEFQLERLDDAVQRLAALRLSRPVTQPREAFVPEAELLAAVLYMWTDQYDQADAVLRAYLEQLRSIRRALRDILDAYPRADDVPAMVSALYDLRPALAGVVNGEDTPVPGTGDRAEPDARAAMVQARLARLHPVLEDLLRDRSVSGAMHRVENIRADFATLSRQMDWWQETALFAALRARLVSEEQRAIADTGRSVQAALEQYRLWLGELNVMGLAYRREVTLLRLRDATGDRAVLPYRGEPLPPFDFVHP